MDAAKATLLQHCEQLSHNERMKYMVLLGKDALLNSSSRDLVTKLSHGALYEQILALQACYGTGDTSLAVHFVKAPSRMLQHRALSCLATIGSDHEVLEALSSLPLYLQEHGLKHLRRRKRYGIVDPCLGRLRKSESKDVQETFEKLLWTASPGMVNEVLSGIFDELHSSNLIRLLHRDAEVVFTVVRSKLYAESAPKASFIKMVNDLLYQTYAKDHVGRVWDLILDIVKILSNTVPLMKLRLRELLKRKLNEVVEFVIDRGVKDFTVEAKDLRKLATPELLQLQKLNSNFVSISSFASLREDQRLAVYELMSAFWRNKQGMMDLRIIKALPLKERLKEARRHIQLPVFETRPQGRIAYAALLPWEEAMPLQDPFIRSNVADTRSSALSEQIQVAYRRRGDLGKALDLVVVLRHEQDPVRRICLQALSNIPSSYWKVEYLSVVERIIRDSLDASDLSNSSVDALLKMTCRILPYNSKWASKQLILIMMEYQQSPVRIELPESPSIKTEDVMMDLNAALLPVLEKLRKPDMVELLVSISEALQKYLQYFPSLLSAMEEILEDTESSSVASLILDIMFAYQPQRLPELIPRLLNTDPGWIAFPLIEEYMVRHKLNEYQELEECGGRFGMVRLTIRTPWPHSTPWKTTQLQQEKDLHRVLLIIEDRDQGVNKWQACVKSLATLTYVDFGFLIKLTSDERVLVRDTAIRILGRLDAGQGIPTLLAALKDDERVRIAMYSLRPVMRYIPTAELLKLLQAAPMTKVTVAKEVIRMARDLNTENSYRFLRGLTNRDLHRDTLSALLGALASDIDHDQTFELFQRTSQHKEASIPFVILERRPLAENCPQKRVPGRWMLILALLLKHESGEVRTLTLRNCMISLTDEDQILVGPLLALLESPLSEEKLGAAAAVIKLYAPTQAALVGRVFERFSNDYFELQQLVSVYTAQQQSFLATARSTTQLVLEVLAKVPLTSSLRLQVMFRALPWPELRAHIEVLVPNLHADALVKAEELIDQLSSRDGFDFDAVDRDLSASADAQVRRLGFSALNARARQVRGWTGEHRKRLKFYQADASVLVAEAAAFVFLPKLEEE